MTRALVLTEPIPCVACRYVECVCNALCYVCCEWWCTCCEHCQRLRDCACEDWRYVCVCTLCECCADCECDPCRCNTCQQCGSEDYLCECCTRCLSTADDCECCTRCNNIADECDCCGECDLPADECECGTASALDADVQSILERALPGLTTHTACPADLRCAHSGTVSTVIMHLNDTHRWTREAIADWLDTLDADLRFPVPAA